METSSLRYLEREPQGSTAGTANAAVIWMHGLGATADDFFDVPPLLGLPASARIRYVFPQAPSQPVTVNGGWVMPAWYDIRELGGWEREDIFRSGRGQDRPGVERSAAAIVQLIEREKTRGIPAERVVLAGFSQGGAMALHVGLRYPERLAGIMVLSAGLMFADSLATEAAPANRRTPVFLAHGSYDPVVSCQVGQRTRLCLESAGYPVEWHEYAMEHNVVPEELADIGRWLGAALDLR